MKSNDINYTESYKGDCMSYHIPSDKELANFMVSDLHPSHIKLPRDCLIDFIEELETSIKIASLNYRSNIEYIAYLKYLTRYIKASNNGDTSPLIRELEDIFRLRKLHLLL